MKCKYCKSGTEWSPIHNYCGECGAKLKWPTDRTNYEENLADELYDMYRAETVWEPKLTKMELLAKARQMISYAIDTAAEERGRLAGRREALNAVGNCIREMLAADQKS